MMPLEYPPDVTEYLAIVWYMLQKFAAAFPGVSAPDYYDLWVDSKKLGLTTTCDFFHWILKEPPDFYSSFYPSWWVPFRYIMVET